MVANTPVPFLGSVGKLPKIIEARPDPTWGPGGKTTGKKRLEDQNSF